MKTRLLIDVKQRRPGCVLLQAMARGDQSTLHKYFDPNDWLLAPTDEMRVVSGTEEEWAKFSDRFSVKKKVKV